MYSINTTCILQTFLENPPMKANEPKIIRECQKCLVPVHQAQVRVGQLTILSNSLIIDKIFLIC